MPWPWSELSGDRKVLIWRLASRMRRQWRSFASRRSTQWNGTTTKVAIRRVTVARYRDEERYPSPAVTMVILCYLMCPWGVDIKTSTGDDLTASDALYWYRFCSVVWSLIRLRTGNALRSVLCELEHMVTWRAIEEAQRSSAGTVEAAKRSEILLRFEVRFKHPLLSVSGWYVMMTPYLLLQSW